MQSTKGTQEGKAKFKEGNTEMNKVIERVSAQISSDWNLLK